MIPVFAFHDVMGIFDVDSFCNSLQWLVSFPSWISTTELLSRWDCFAPLMEKEMSRIMTDENQAENDCKKTLYIWYI